MMTNTKTKTTTLPPCLEAEGIHWQIENNSILEDINLSLNSGEVLGIIGPNGAGKSSLLKILANVIKPNAGKVKLHGTNFQDIDVKKFAGQLGYLEQSAPVHWPLLVRKVVELGRIPYQGFSQKLSDDDARAITNAVQATGIEPLLNRVITTLSEGEKMLVAITRVLATQAKIILADEPVASLDPYHQLLIMELLQNLTQTSEDFSAIVVLHDLSLAARFCDRLILMSHGKIVSSGSIEEVLSPDNLRRYYRINADIDYQKALITPVSRNESNT